MFDKIISMPNLYRAAYAAARGKRYHDSVAFFNFCMEHEIERLHADLSSGRYRHGPYKVFMIHEPKERVISEAPFRDRVVHHAVHDIIEPGIDRTFISDSYACRLGKGTHAAVERAQSFLAAKAYCLHGDVKKYFYSIDHAILKGLLRRHIHHPRLWALIVEIIDSAPARTAASPGDAGVGLPIGNLTSQFFANLYLHELDFFVKHTLRCRYYIRYMDDFLLFDNDHALLLKWRDAIGAMLAARLNLRLHADKTMVFAVRHGVTFLGFRLSRTTRRICARGMRRFRARLKEFRYLLAHGRMDEAEITASLQCWRAHSLYADTSRLRTRLGYA